MIQFTTIMHSNNHWILIRHTELVDQYRRQIVATFDTAMDAINSDEYISAPLPAAYQTTYSASYKGYLIHVASKVVSNDMNGILSVRSHYVGFVYVNGCAVYLDYLQSSNNEYICTEWRNRADTIGNLKWFIRNQLPPIVGCFVS